MRIDLSQLGAAAIESGRTEGASAQLAGSGQKDVLGVDEATLSSDQSVVRSLEATLGQMPDVRADKVKALRDQIANGTYRVDVSNVASALTREVLGGAVAG